ncbi:MAG: hypothetical protein RM368_28020 [Nostoc sp. DedSLP03]|uniref:hypothetical protein n=1 Tax=Nostoc sp. DedSLP03 TaxID=3075400 RepID=UPI002AD22290|nr:hypothetical protein [Nostoc sp. DedSLP03]MDZ7968755.1 hypothetical protein [Nostoc sp. DedSLP03]
MPLYPASVNIDFNATELNAAIASITNALATLQTTVEDNEGSITSIATELANQNTRLGNIEIAESSLWSNFNGLVSNVNSLTQTVDSQDSIISYVNNENANQRVQIQDLQTQIVALQKVLPQGFQHFHDTSKVLVGNALSPVQVAASFYSTMWQQNPAALNDSFSFTALLSPGTYTLVMLVTRANNKGKLKLSINGVQAFDDLDGYNSTTIYERITRTITITTSGLQEFVFTVWGKNSLSSGYAFLVNKISAYKM